MAGLAKTMDGAERRRTNARLRRFFSCPDRAWAIHARFNTLYAQVIAPYNYTHLPLDCTVAKLLNKPILARLASSRLQYDESTATAIIHASHYWWTGKSRFRQNPWARRHIASARRFNQIPKVVPVLLPRSLCFTAT